MLGQFTAKLNVVSCCCTSSNFIAIVPRLFNLNILNANIEFQMYSINEN